MKAGRKKHEGNRHTYTVADDVHDYIIKNGAGKLITETFRVIKLTKEGRI